MTKQEAVNKLVNLARGEVGYREGTGNWTKYADDPKVAQLYGWCPQNQPWCCTFVNWCFLNAFGVDIGSKLTYGGTAACANSAGLFRAAGAFVRFPEVGDQAFYYSGGGINHTGLVVAVDGTSFTAIEGNYSDKVSLVTHNIGKGDVAGFGRPNWSLIAQDQSADITAPNDPVSSEKGDSLTLEDHIWKPGMLKYGSKCADVCVLQSLLVAKRFFTNSNPREVDGDFGAKTQAAVTAAQRFYGLETDGICGPDTWSKLLKVG